MALNSVFAFAIIGVRLQQKFYFYIKHDDPTKKYTQNMQNFFIRLCTHQVQVPYLIRAFFHAFNEIRSTQQKYE